MLNFFLSLWELLPFKEFLNPNKRIYWPYLALCLFYTLLFLLIKRKGTNNSYFKVWTSSSVRTDLAIWCLNYFIQITIFPIIFINALLLASKFSHLLGKIFGYSKIMGMTFGGLVWYSIVFLVLSDFSRFMLHYALHHISFLTPLHRLHHSAEVLTPITFFRSHPLEMMLSQCRFIIVYSVVTGFFLYLYNDFQDFPKIFGASFFVVISNLLAANLRHSNIAIGFGFFEYFFVSPKQHQMHHSIDRSLSNSNLGSMFAIWDILFSTWMPSKGISKITFGSSDNKKLNFINEIVYPFESWIRILKKR